MQKHNKDWSHYTTPRSDTLHGSSFLRCLCQIQAPFFSEAFCSTPVLLLNLLRYVVNIMSGSGEKYNQLSNTKPNSPYLKYLGKAVQLIEG